MIRVDGFNNQSYISLLKNYTFTHITIGIPPLWYIHRPPPVSAGGFFLAFSGQICQRLAMKKRAAFYVDGFNLYHSIDNLKDNSLKWLCLQKLANELIPSRDENVHLVKYFSAVATHRSPESMLRHKVYIAALQAQGIVCVLGKFKRKPKGCHTCGARWDSHEEKETDVNIAIQMIDDAYNDQFDVCYVVSADTDLLPPMRLLQSRFKDKILVAVSPPGRPHGKEIKQIADRSMKLNESQLARCQLPDALEHEGRAINRPVHFK